VQLGLDVAKSLSDFKRTGGFTFSALEAHAADLAGQWHHHQALEILSISLPHMKLRMSTLHAPRHIVGPRSFLTPDDTRGQWLIPVLVEIVRLYDVFESREVFLGEIHF